MSDSYKPGGGNKPQPYIPAGNGEKSGEYTDKPVSSKKPGIKNCFIRNVRCVCNFLHSKCVKKVTCYSSFGKGENIPSRSKPNSVIKKVINGYVVSERYYGEKGEAYLDIDYTCHGNPSTHPEVPHMHHWYKDENGDLKRNKKWESFK